MKIRPFFAWYDLWIGAYYDRARRCLYVCPVPTVGVVIQFGCDERLWQRLADLVPVKPEESGR